MLRKSGDWWLVTSHSQFLIPNPYFQTFSGGFAAPKRKPTPPRCARQPLPREGACVDTPSFLWKEVPRRGGDWMGKAVFPYHSLHQWGRQRGGGFAAKKEANPASLRSAAPSKGRGLRGYTLLPMEGGAPKGRRLDGESGISVSQPSPMGKAKRRRLRRKKGSQPRLAALGSPFQGKGLAWTLPPSYGRRCPEGAEVGWEKRYEKERRRSSQVEDKREHPIPRYRDPPSPCGKGNDTRAPLSPK